MISQHIITASVVGPLGLDVAVLPVKGGTFTMDENNAPFLRAQLTLAAPAEETMALLDPRGTPPRIRLTLQRNFTTSLPVAALSIAYPGQPVAALSADYPAEDGKKVASLSEGYTNYLNGYPGPPPEPPLAVLLYLLDAREDYAQAEMTLTLGGPEILLIQDVASGEAPYHPGAVSLIEVVLYVLAMTIPGGAGVRADGVVPTVDADASEWKPGTSAWNYLRGLTEQAGMRLWSDERGSWRLAANPLPENAPHEWSPANCKTMDRTLSRSGSWGDATLVLYDWEDANGDRQSARDYAKDVPDPTKPRVFQRDVPYPGPGAAAHLLRFVRARGQDVTLSAVSDYQVVPGDVASVTLPNGTRLTKTVASVDYNLGTDEMTVTLRDPLLEGDS